MAEKKSKILNTTSVCIIYMLFGFAFAEAPQPGTIETLIASELYPDVEPGTIDTTVSFNQLVAINVKKTLENTYISEEQILKYIQEAPLPFNFELSINHSVVIKGNHTNFQIQPSFVIEASELYQPVEAELEDLFKGLHSKLEDAEKKVGELLETKKYRIQELEEQNATLEKKCSDLKAESVKNAEKVAELESELEEFRTKAIEKENELTEKYDEALKSSGEKLSEAETLVEVLRIELCTKQENLKSIENDLQAAGLRESEIMEKLKSAEDQLEHVNLKKSELEARIAELEEKLSIKDSEANELIEMLIALEGQVKLYEDQVREAETRKIELEKTNLKLTQEKDETYEQLQTSKKAVEDLTQQVASERQKFQAQIASLLEENNLLNESYGNTKSVLLELEEKLKVAKENEDALKVEIENLKAEISEKSNLQIRVKELEEQLVTVESQLKQEVEKVKADFAEKVREGVVLNEQIIKLQKELKRSVDELDAKKKEIFTLDQKINELEQKPKVEVEPKDGMEVKSRDIEFSVPSPTTPSSAVQARSEASVFTSLTFILGVAFVSVVIGIVLGKRY